MLIKEETSNYFVVELSSLKEEVSRWYECVRANDARIMRCRNAQTIRKNYQLKQN